VRNALSVLSVIVLMKLPLDKAAAALAQFTGAGRRFDIKGEVDGITVIDDYGHHPTEIRTTLAGARARYAQRKLWAIWQPHTYSRTQMLFKEFTEAFADADEVIVTEIYRSREAVQDYSSKLVVDAMKHPHAHFMSELNDVAEYLLKHLRPGDVMITFSAGDADQISAKVLETLKQETHHAI
jgi:UDP-N-acetylmuramate--alanine ligase